jgi:phage-related protein
MAQTYVEILLINSIKDVSGILKQSRAEIIIALKLIQLIQQTKDAKNY